MKTPNLYRNGKYWKYRDPRTGKSYSLGTDEKEAIRQAQEANAALPKLSMSIPKLGEHIDLYVNSLSQRGLAENTLYNRKQQMKAIKQGLGDVEISPDPYVTANMAKATAQFLYTYGDKRRMAQAMKATLSDFYSWCVANGLLNINVCQALKLPPPRVRRERLSLDSLQAILGASGGMEPWVERSILIALVTTQRLEDVSNLKFSDIQDGKLCVIQGKTKARLRIPLTLTLNGFPSLGELVKRDHVVSQYILHHTVSKGQARAGEKVHPATLSSSFLRARKLAGIGAEEGKNPPSFHELRSLGIRLYQAQGYNPQGLAGHKDPETTKIYLDGRNQEWIDVAA